MDTPDAGTRITRMYPEGSPQEQSEGRNGLSVAVCVAIIVLALTVGFVFGITSGSQLLTGREGPLARTPSSPEGIPEPLPVNVIEFDLDSGKTTFQRGGLTRVEVDGFPRPDPFPIPCSCPRGAKLMLEVAH